MTANVATAVLFLVSSVLAVGAPESSSQLTLAVGMLGGALAVIAFFLKRTLDRVEGDILAIRSRLHDLGNTIVGLEAWRVEHEKRGRHHG